MIAVLDTTEAGPKFIRGTALRIAGYAIGLLCATGSSALLLRHLGVVDSGRYVTVLALLTIVGGVSDLGLSSLALREYAVLEGRSRTEFMSNLLGMRLAYTVVGVGIAFAFGAIAGYERAMLIGIPLAGLGVLLGALQQSIGVPLSAGLKLGWVTALAFGGPGRRRDRLRRARRPRRGTGLVLRGSGGGDAAGPRARRSIVRRATPMRPTFDAAVWKRTMREILPFSAAVVFYVLYFRFAVLSVSLLSTARETGYYAAAFRVLDALTLIPPLLASSAFPLLARAARDDSVRLEYAMRRLFEAMVIVGTWMSLSLGVGRPVRDRRRRGPVPPVDRRAARAVDRPARDLHARDVGLRASVAREAAAILWANCVSVLIAATLCLLLIPAHGALGAAIAQPPPRSRAGRGVRDGFVPGPRGDS